jgi:hypothetical protein
VTTLADKLGWLIGTLHLFKHRGVRPFLSFALTASSVVDYGERASPANAGSMDRTCAGLYGPRPVESIIPAQIPSNAGKCGISSQARSAYCPVASVSGQQASIDNIK